MDRLVEFDWFDAVCENAFESKRRGCVLMIFVYLDASANFLRPDDPLPPVHTLGAYLGSQESWRKFRKEWRRELDKKNLPYFHMTDFEFARNKAIKNHPIPENHLFSGWELEEFDPFLKRLHDVINRRDRKGNYRLESWTSTVLKTDFDTCMPKEIADDVKCSSYYVFNIVQILKAIAAWSKMIGEKEPIHYVFAGGDGEGGNIEKLFTEMWNNPIAREYYRLNKGYSHLPYSVDMTQGEPALQAADIAAYEMQKLALLRCENGWEEVSHAQVRESLKSLGRTHHFQLIYRKDELQQSFDEIIDGRKRFLTIPRWEKLKTNPKRKKGA